MFAWGCVMGVRFYFGLGAWVVRGFKWVRGSFSLTPVIVYSGFTRMNVLVLQRILHNTWLLVGLLLMLLMGCSESEQAKKEKYLATLPSDHGKTVEVNGKKFSIIYVGGMRFRIPDDGNSIGDDYFHLSFYWPNIPLGKVPGTNPVKWFDKKPDEARIFIAQVNTRYEPAVVDKTSEPGLEPWDKCSNYIVHDDLTLGLRIFTKKEFPTFPSFAYSLSKDAV